MYYDSMIAKLIVHGSDRNEAIAKMREALNGFVIRGISSNIPFQAALLAHPKFVAGDFNTGFIAEHYGQGLSRRRAARRPTCWARWRPSPRKAASAPPASPARCRPRVRGGRGLRRGRSSAPASTSTSVRVSEFEPQGGAVVEINGSALRDREPTGTWGPAHARHRQRQALHRAGGARRRQNPLAYRIGHNGAQVEALVLTPRAAELHKLMPYKAPPDMSRFLLSPMPGLLVDVAVQPGQKVQAGERVAVIEAMKMENVLFAAPTAWWARCWRQGRVAGGGPADRGVPVITPEKSRCDFCWVRHVARPGSRIPATGETALHATARSRPLRGEEIRKHASLQGAGHPADRHRRSRQVEAAEALGRPVRPARSRAPSERARERGRGHLRPGHAGR